MEKHIELIARALIRRNGKVLLVKRSGANYFFLPGGHVEFGETAEQALKREMVEEIGQRLTSLEFLGVNENLYVQDGISHHEYNLLFSGEIKNSKVESLEDYLTFEWIPESSFAGTRILPVALKEAAAQALLSREIFYSSEKRSKV